MRALAVAIPVLLTLAGCAGSYDAPASATPEPIRERPVAGACTADPVQYHVGHDATEEMGAAILKESGAATLRWGPPNSAWTMDYREDRVNVRYDASMKITAVTCG